MKKKKEDIPINGDFLKDRLAPGQCSKCLTFKIITVRFGEERVCKSCLDAISIDIANQIVQEIGVVDEIVVDQVPVPKKRGRKKDSAPLPGLNSEEVQESAQSGIPMTDGLVSQQGSLAPSSDGGGNSSDIAGWRPL